MTDTITYSIDHYSGHLNEMPDSNSILSLTTNGEGNHALSCSNPDVDVEWLARNVAELLSLDHAMEFTWKQRDSDEKQAYMEAIDELCRSTGLAVRTCSRESELTDGGSALSRAVNALYPRIT